MTVRICSEVRHTLSSVAFSDDQLYLQCQQCHTDTQCQTCSHRNRFQHPLLRDVLSSVMHMGLITKTPRRAMLLVYHLEGNFFHL